MSKSAKRAVERNTAKNTAKRSVKNAVRIVCQLVLVLALVCASFAALKAECVFAEEVTNEEPLGANSEAVANVELAASDNIRSADEMANEWANTHSKLRIGIIRDYMPMCRMDSDGTVSGVVTDIGNCMIDFNYAKDTMSAEYVSYESFAQMVEGIANNEIDILFPIVMDKEYLEGVGISASTEIIEVPMYVAYLGEYDESTFDRVVISSKPLKKLEQFYPDSEIINAKNARQCMDALFDGTATCTIMSSYRIYSMLNDTKYEDVKTLPFGVSTSYCVGVQKGNEELLAFVNRAIEQMDPSVFLDRVFRNIQMDKSYSTVDFLREHYVFVLTLAVSILGVIILILTAYAQRIRVADLATKQKIEEVNELNNELKLNEDALREKEAELSAALADARRANDAKTEFLSHMSHDIRTPLNGIVGLLEISDKHCDNQELLTENRRKARIAANHLLSLINDVLDMSKLGDANTELPCEPFDVYEMCGEALNICSIRALDNGITMTHDSGVNLRYRWIYGSALHLKQINMNLINNAIKYNKLGGSIHLGTSLRSLEGDIVTYDFVVSDTGIGMSKEFLEHIYEPFSQEKSDARSRYQGTGIGMAIVKTLVDKMNGTIDVQSELGVGTTFTVTIPFKICNEEVARQEQHNVASSASIEEMNILLVEDNELNLEIAKVILEDAGANITTANDGLEAVEIYEKSPAGSFDVILMDIMMPRLDGYGATARIRKSEKADAQSIPIVAMTANAFAEDVKQAKEAGMNEHIAKPLEFDKMIRLLAGYRR